MKSSRFVELKWNATAERLPSLPSPSRLAELQLRLVNTLESALGGASCAIIAQPRISARLFLSALFHRSVVLKHFLAHFFRQFLGHAGQKPDSANPVVNDPQAFADSDQ